MSCRLFESELDAYFDGELNAESSKAIREHLGKCDCCRRRLADRAALASLVRAAPFYSIPDHLRARVLAQADGGRSVAPSRADFVVGAGTTVAGRCESSVEAPSGIFRKLERSCRLIEGIGAMHILGLCGSLRRHSYNRRLLAAAAKELPDDAVFVVFEDIATIPPYNEDIEARETPAAVHALRGAIAAASGILITTPEYNASVPGLLKNAIDWASRPYPDHGLRGKPVIVAGASISAYGATLALAELRRVLNVIGAHVLEGELAVAQAHEAFAPDGSLADPQLRSELASLVQALVASVTESSGDLASRRVG